MRRAALWLPCLPLLLAAASCAEPELEVGTDRPEILGFAGGGTPENPRPARLLIAPTVDTSTDAVFAAGDPIIIFMNRNGGTYTPGNDNASNNRSSIPNQTSNIQPWNVSDSGWAQVMTHMQEIWAPYNVVITDVDPGATPHFESVMAGFPQNVGMPSGVLGVSPYTLNCSVIPNSIVYTFADYAVQLLGNDYREIAEIASQEVAHSFGLDHQLLASDPMTYLPFNANRSFKDQAANCGEDNPRPCGLSAQNPCSGLGVPGSTTQQNSHQALLQRIGPKGELAPPQISIDSPQNGAVVTRGFTVAATAQPATGATISKVDLVIDGAVVDTLTAPPFTFTTSTTLAAGQHTVATRATDSNAQTSEATIQVTLDDGTGEPGDPNDPSEPGDPNDPGDPGDPGNPGDPGAPDSDPAEITGSCSAAGSASSQLGTALLLTLACLTLTRRRRSSSR